jgi:O-antigen/teichoic acid export membrane protein
MTILKKNISANLIGNIWQVAMGLVFIPLYIKFMGVESYGLVGIFSALLVLSGLLDMGLSGTLNREMARLSVLPGSEQTIRNLVRTLEIIYWVIAIIIGIIIVALSPFIAHHWVNADKLTPQVIENAISIMGIAIALQLPAGFYIAGLVGIQCQIILNVVAVGISTMRGAGAVLVLWLISPTIQSFFSWQIIVSATYTILLAKFFWERLPLSGNRPVFQKHLLKGIWRFAAGIGGSTILAIILAQMDKIILSRMLSLEMFGYYTFASTLAMSPLRLAGPLYTGLYPRLTQLVSLQSENGLKSFYHKSSQFMAVMILPLSIIVALFPYEIILLWTQNQTTAENTHVLITILICGAAIKCLTYIPNALQWAFGWTRLSFFKNLIAVILIVPLMIYMTNHYGATGAACAWLLLNIGFILLEIPIMHRILLQKEKWRWYWQDVLIPLATVLVIAGLAKIFIHVPQTNFSKLIYLIALSSFTLGITAIVTPVTRDWLSSWVLKIKPAERS